MSDERLIPDAQAQALIDEVDKRTREKSEALIAAANLEARKILKVAHRDARARLRDAVARLRNERETALIRQRASIELEQRTTAQRRAATLMATGWPLIEKEMRRRWQEVEDRAAWIDEAIRLAAVHLSEGSWSIYVPEDLTREEAARLKEKAGQGECASVECIVDSSIEAGLRIASNDAVVDATPAGLLADSQTVNAMLLAELGKTEPAEERPGLSPKGTADD